VDDIGLLIGIGARGIERLLVVLFAGLSIYFGFRLFLALPTQNNQQGEIELPGFKVVLSKVGPGVFFAAFGSAVLIASFTHPVSVDLESGSYAGAVSQTVAVSALSTPNAVTGRAAELDRIALALQTLNCLPAYAQAAQGRLLAGDIEPALRDAKLALLQPVWDQMQWGDYARFKAWAHSGAGQVPDKIQILYLAQTDC